MTASAVPTFVLPANLDCSDWSQLEPIYQALLDRPIASAADLERWLLDLSHFCCVVDEYGSRLYIDKSCHTDDAAVEKRFMHFVENIQPRIKPLMFKLQKKFVASPHRAGRPLDTVRVRMLERLWRMEIEVFREANIPLQTEQTKLTTEYDKICGAMLVSFRGKEYTLQQMARFQEETDRATRQAAWEAGQARARQDWDRVEAVFERLLALRRRIAANADCADYREYIWKCYNRFDYTPAQCLQFADAIAEACVPVVRQLDDRRQRALGLPALRPWDLAVDPLARPPLRPFQEDRIDDFVARTAAVFDRIAPDLGRQFRQLKMGRNLDLDSRKGKRPGGYQSSLELSREPFIFMNAAGLQRDVETMLHEGGHAFHYLAAREEPVLFLRSAPIEFCEVASMSMELLGDDHLDVYYGDDEAGRANALRAKRVHLETIVRLLPWIAIVDSFQHWLYTHPGHSRAERAGQWLAIHQRFSSPRLDWSGLEDVRGHLWQRQIHLFSYPFYYVEYGIAQLGALGVWLNYRKDPKDALARLLEAFRLGGTRPLPELFQTAGVPFDFSAQTLQPLLAAVGEELARLPA